jgi:hypothetical protein
MEDLKTPFCLLVVKATATSTENKTTIYLLRSFQCLPATISLIADSCVFFQKESYISYN